MRVYKTLVQKNTPSKKVEGLMNCFKEMINYCVKTALNEKITSRNALSKRVYRKLSRNFKVPSYYYVASVNKAIGIVKNYNKVLRKRENKEKNIGKKLVGGNEKKRVWKDLRKPVVRKPFLSSYFGFKIKNNQLLLPVGVRDFETIPLNNYVQSKLEEGVEVRSFTITSTSLCLNIGKTFKPVECLNTLGVDRNLNNVTVGNESHHLAFDLSLIPKIKKRYRNKLKHFHRNDVRIKRKLFSKYGKRSSNRAKQVLHKTSKMIVENALSNKEALVLENIKGLKDITFKGDGKSKKKRFSFHNSFPYFMLAQQLKYKAEWDGLQIIQLSRKETRNSSVQCSVCECETRIVPERLVFCSNCGSLIDRDVNASLNIARRGRTRLKRSFINEKGSSGEAMVLEPNEPGLTGEVIQPVDEETEFKSKNLKMVFNLSPKAPSIVLTGKI